MSEASFETVLSELREAAPRGPGEASRAGSRTAARRERRFTPRLRPRWWPPRSSSRLRSRIGSRPDQRSTGSRKSGKTVAQAADRDSAHKPRTRAGSGAGCNGSAEAHREVALAETGRLDEPARERPFGRDPERGRARRGASADSSRVPTTRPGRKRATPGWRSACPSRTSRRRSPASRSSGRSSPSTSRSPTSRAGSTGSTHGSPRPGTPAMRERSRASSAGATLSSAKAPTHTSRSN